jgi:dihydroorotase/N-acyl-D-amino-acid deacylase
MRKWVIQLVLLLSPLGLIGQQYDILIRNGRVVDGTGNPWVYADVGVIGDRISFVGPAPAHATAKRVIDAKGLIVGPGFIDMLDQSEWNLLIDKQAVSKLTQGITSGITGEGGSIAPQNDQTIADRRDFLEHYHLTVDWRDLDGYFDGSRNRALPSTSAPMSAQPRSADTSWAAWTGHPRPQRLTRMQELVEQAMRQGAMGLSTSLIYAPASYAKTDELIALAKVAPKYRGIYASHIRNEGDHEMEALDEAFRIGREAGIPVEIWHLKVSGRQNWGKMPRVIATIESARASGLDVTANQYSYIASGTSLGATISPKYHEGGSEAFVQRLQNPQVRAAIRQELSGASGSLENMWRGTGGPQGILIASVLDPALRRYEGRTIAQIATDEHKEPLDALLDLVIAGKDHIGAVYFTMSEDDVKFAMQQGFVSVGTDSGAVNFEGPVRSPTCRSCWWEWRWRNRSLLDQRRERMVGSGETSSNRQP